MRLVGGDSSLEGLVEICANGDWATVCHDSWDNNDAIVVCRQLQHSTLGKQKIVIIKSPCQRSFSVTSAQCVYHTIVNLDPSKVMYLYKVSLST